MQSLKTTRSLVSVGSSKSSTTAARELYKKSTTSKPKLLPKYVPPCSEVRQRVLSAKALHNKIYRNQLLEAERTIEKLRIENRMLLKIQQRQDNALAKYESENADLPNILNGHVEELNGWEEKHRKLQNNAKELEEQIKQRDAIIYDLNEEIKFYEQLKKIKKLHKKEELLEKINALQVEINEVTEEQRKTTEQLRSEIERTKRTIVQERVNCHTIAKKLKQMHEQVNEMDKVDTLELEKTVLNEQTNNEDTDASMSSRPFNVAKPATVCESIPTRIPCRKFRSINTVVNKPITESEGETKVKNKPINRKPVENLNGNPRPALRKKPQVKQGTGDGPGNTKANRLRVKFNMDRGDGDGPNKHKSYQLNNRNSAIKQDKSQNTETTPSKNAVFCEHAESNYCDTDGNESVIETVDSQTPNMSVTSDLTGDTCNLADTDDQDDMPQSLLETDDDLNMHCMGKIMSGLRVQMSDQYANQCHPYMENYSELEQSN